MNVTLHDFNCPHCGSENTRKLSLIYRDGIVHTHGHNVKIGYYQGTSQNVSSKNASPPITPVGYWWISLIGGIFIGGILWAIIFGLLVLISSILELLYLKFLNVPLALLAVIVCYTVVPVIVFLWMKKVNDDYAKKYLQIKRDWDNSYQCQRCGGTFII